MNRRRRPALSAVIGAALALSGCFGASRSGTRGESESWERSYIESHADSFDAIDPETGRRLRRFNPDLDAGVVWIRTGWDEATHSRIILDGGLSRPQRNGPHTAARAPLPGERRRTPGMAADIRRSGGRGHFEKPAAGTARQ